MPILPAQAHRTRPPRLRLAAGMTTLVVVCLVFLLLTTRASLLAQVVEEANAHVEAGIEQFVTYTDTAVDPRTGLPHQSAPRLVESYLSHRVPDPDEALVAAVDGEIVQMEGAGRRLEAGSPLVEEILAVPASSGVVTDPDGGTVHWGRVEVTGPRTPVTVVVARWTDSARERVDRQLSTQGALSVLTAGLAAALSWFLAGRWTRHSAPPVTTGAVVDVDDLTRRIAVALQADPDTRVTWTTVADPAGVDTRLDAGRLAAALLPAALSATRRADGEPVEFGSSLKGAGSDRTLSLWLRDRGEAIPRDRLDALLEEGSLRDTAREYGGRAWAESMAGLGTVLGVDLPAPGPT